MNGSSAPAREKLRSSERSPSHTVTTPMRIGSRPAAGCAGDAEHPTSGTSATIDARSGPDRLRIARHPDGSLADADIDRASAHGERESVPGWGVDLGDVAVDRVGDPEGVATDGHTLLFAADGDRLHDATARGIDLVQLVGDLAGHPDMTEA